MGRWFSDKLDLGIRIKPAIDDHVIMIEAIPIFRVLDALTKAEVYTFETRTTFCFSGRHSKVGILQLSHQSVCQAVDEFNRMLQQSGSQLVLGRVLGKPTLADLEPAIHNALQSTPHPRWKVTPNWKIFPVEDVTINDDLLAKLPAIPPCKHFYHTDDVYRPNQPTTPEAAALSRILSGTLSTSQDLDTIQDAVHFYQHCFPILSQIDLTAITESQAKLLNDYLRYVFNAQVTINNEVQTQNLFRVTLVKDEFLENGKVRQSRFLSYPPVEIIKARGVYNRASSPDRTLLYTAESVNTAVREVKPRPGDRIIVSTWFNHSGTPLVVFPICVTAGINNHHVDSATVAFEMIHGRQHPAIGNWMELMMAFIANAFVKECDTRHPKRFDYLYSAYLGDHILQPFPPGNSMKDYDCILYPSVAGKHATSNLAILPGTVDKKFMISNAVEYAVAATWYDRDFVNDSPPAQLKVIRSIKSLTNGRITWDDDQ
jgi:hypothetical protein